MEMKIYHHGWQAIHSLSVKEGETRSGGVIDIPKSGASIKYNGGTVCKSFGIPEVSEFIITFSSGVAAGVVANHIYNKLIGQKSKIEKIEVDHKVITLDKGELTQVIHDHLKYEKEQ